MRAAKYLLTILLTLGIFLFYAILSSIGSLLIFSSLFIAGAAFFLAGVESELYRKSIFEGFDYIKLLGKQGIRHAIVNELDYYVKNEANCAEPP